MKFHQYVLDRGKINEQQLKEVLLVSQFKKEKMGRLLVQLNFLSEEELDSLLIDYLKPKNEFSYQVMREMIEQVTLSEKEELFVKENHSIVLEITKKKVLVLVEFFSDQVVQRFEQFFGREIELKVTDRSIIQLLRSSLGAVETVKRNESTIIVTRNLSDDEKLQERDPYTKLIKSCFEAAKKARASDIHFENFDKEYLIRFRVHGKLCDWKTLAVEHAMPMTSRLKYILNMDLAVVGTPQDSRATIILIGADIRANSMPVASGGEKIVLRLQYQDQNYNIRSLGLSDGVTQVLLDQITKSDGLILISGPTGSGKTTTLYALLEEMDRMGKNISTLEHPVEKKLARINQANVHDHKDFNDFQKALMRQDPDVILLGEIRDSETASLSLKLASTGHLVLSTIHANGAVEVLDRMTNLGADLFSLKANLRLSIAQRLVREICPHCSVSAPDDLVEKLKGEGHCSFKVTNLNGCKMCHQGVVGRIAIIEYLDKHDLTQLGKIDLKVKISIADQCLEFSRLGKIDLKDALFYQ